MPALNRLFDPQRQPRRLRRSGFLFVVAVTAALVAVAASAGTASAATDAEATVQVTSASITSNGGLGGNCTWMVDAKVTATNLDPTRSRTVFAGSLRPPLGNVTWSDASGSGVASVSAPQSVVWQNGMGYMALGAAGAFHSTVTGTASNVTFTIPCAATNGQLTIDFQFLYGTYPAVYGPEVDVSASDTFLQNGAPLPLFAGLGGLLFTAALGGGLLVIQRRRRRTATR